MGKHSLHLNDLQSDNSPLSGNVFIKLGSNITKFFRINKKPPYQPNEFNTTSNFPFNTNDRQGVAGTSPQMNRQTFLGQKKCRRCGSKVHRSNDKFEPNVIS